MAYTLSNKRLTISVNSLGAELCSLRGASGTEYLWNADPSWWKRSSPVLFPFVGSLRDGQYRYEGRTYPMSQHGFARDMEFTLTEQTADTVSLRLCSNSETLERYPFPFQLDISYRLAGNSVTVAWDVTNLGEKTMYFSIGAHPAFVCPPEAPFLEGKSKRRTDYSIRLDAETEIAYRLLEDGLLCPKNHYMPLDGGSFAITPDTFQHDALIVEGGQAHAASLTQRDGTPCVTVLFDSPLFGLWSPPGDAPFVCIEPWYGRCDSQDFDGSLEQRDYTNSLEAGSRFHAEYVIRLDQE
ncbi:MAG: aldose 1-epimerase family protein [Oscillospiraceae bacterium]|jgi:galactose mutarotase-like enzyme|nr:aldose 1-epimerase family protein [Oscillospiraceae bacterium]